MPETYQQWLERKAAAKKPSNSRFVEDGEGLTVIRDGKEYTLQQIIDMGKREQRDEPDK